MLNLVINARNAMPRGGIVAIATSLRTVEHNPELALGEYLELRVGDSGTGMSQNVIDRTFEPFFTTKGIGEGTGLGLARVRGTARHAG